MAKNFIKVKATSKNFLCALCSVHRKMKYSKSLSPKHYIQILLISTALVTAGWSFVGVNSLVMIPLIWCAFEFTNKVLYRKDIPCPHCGFDATWYRRDVKMAKLKVERFWEYKNSQKPVIEAQNSVSEVQ